MFVAATFLVTPYVLNYDMVIFGCIVGMLRQREENAPLDHWLGRAVWSLPVTRCIWRGVIPLGPPAVMAFAGCLLWRLAHAPQEAAASREVPTPA